MTETTKAPASPVSKIEQLVAAYTAAVSARESAGSAVNDAELELSRLAAKSAIASAERSQKDKASTQLEVGRQALANLQKRHTEAQTTANAGTATVAAEAIRGGAQAALAKAVKAGNVTLQLDALTTEGIAVQTAVYVLAGLTDKITTPFEFSAEAVSKIKELADKAVAAEAEAKANADKAQGVKVAAEKALATAAAAEKVAETAMMAEITKVAATQTTA